MAIAEKVWTLDELHSLPDDGNAYELIHGALFVTPAPTPAHEMIAARINRAIDPYVERHGLGLVYRPHAVIQRVDSQVEPDLMVGKSPLRGATWADAPLPVLVVEVLSPTTRRRDREHKRDFYRELGIAEYWIVDPDAQTITAIRADGAEVVATQMLEWRAPGATEPFTLDVAKVFAWA